MFGQASFQALLYQLEAEWRGISWQRAGAAGGAEVPNLSAAHVRPRYHIFRPDVRAGVHREMVRRRPQYLSQDPTAAFSPLSHSELLRQGADRELVRAEWSRGSERSAGIARSQLLEVGSVGSRQQNRAPCEWKRQNTGAARGGRECELGEERR